MERPTPIRIARVARCRICRDAFGLRVQERPEYELVVNLQRLGGKLDELATQPLHVALLDTDLAGGAFEVAESIRQWSPTTRLIFVGPRVSDLCLKQALSLDAAGFVLSSETVDQLLEHVWKVAGGEQSYSPELQERLQWDSQQQAYRLPSNSVIDSMTAEQLQILRHVARGDSLKMIASKMKLTCKSVDGHKYRLMKKIGVQDRVLLSRFAIREGLIEA